MFQLQLESWNINESVILIPRPELQRVEQEDGVYDSLKKYSPFKKIAHHLYRSSDHVIIIIYEAEVIFVADRSQFAVTAN